MLIYKVMSGEDWRISQESGYVKLGPLDTQFIHMCSADQIENIISKFWQNCNEVVILTIDSDNLHGDLRHEANHPGGTMYYHLYATSVVDLEQSIPLNAVVETKHR